MQKPYIICHMMTSLDGKIEGVSAVQSKNQLITIMSITAFILCGFRHCIADIPFLMLTTINIINYLKYILIICGNVLGARLFRFLTK